MFEIKGILLSACGLVYAACQRTRDSHERLKHPDEIRKPGGALFADFRYATVFVYHNSAPSYYAARGFRWSLRV